ncbi:MAG TPA: phosphoribosylformylglycinamidine cyclo-ligase [Aminobacterium sp.]|nr:phosphoribosylformylglycinamidine cyclo-ligase [Aminobacterium sp.]
MWSYKEAGVDINSGNAWVKTIGRIVNSQPRDPNVVGGIGGFSGLYPITEDLYLAGCCDGVGTKLEVAKAASDYKGLGQDLVAMNVNDLITCGARPLFFLDYIACGYLDQHVLEPIVQGVAEACTESGCALLGGETAEMPGFYSEGEYDMAGFAVGVAEKDEIIDGSKVKNGDVLVGIASSGVHSNGYSLVRKLITDLDADFSGKTFGAELLPPTKIYVKPVLELVRNFDIKAMAHITGGGFFENIPRMFKEDFTAFVNKDSFPKPEIFNHIMKLGVSEEEMYNTYNMGIGFVLCVSSQDANRIINKLSEMGEKAYLIGEVRTGDKKVCLK